MIENVSKEIIPPNFPIYNKRKCLIEIIYKIKRFFQEILRFILYPQTFILCRFWIFNLDCFKNVKCLYKSNIKFLYKFENNSRVKIQGGGANVDSSKKIDPNKLGLIDNLKKKS